MMKATWNVIEKTDGELKVLVDGEEWSNARERAFKKLAKKTKIKGFREGQAPEKMLRSVISNQEILMNAIDEVANEALVFGVKEHDLDLIARPSLDIEAITEAEVTLKFGCTIAPEVTVGKYKGVEYEEEKVKVAASEVKEQLEAIQKDYTELVIKEEGYVEQGNTVVIDFEGFKDGVAFEGGKAENYSLEIGSNTFIPGFEEQLIGMTTDEQKDIDVTFPESYQVAELAGQPVVFTVKVNEIKTKVVPEMTDELVKEVNIPGVDTVKDLEKMIKNDLKSKKEKEQEDKVINDILTEVVDASSCEIPQVMVDEETESLVDDFKNRLAQQGIQYEMYLQMVGSDDDTIREQMSKDAYNKVKVRLVLAKIAEVEKIEVSDEEVAAEYESMAKQYQMEADQIKEYVSDSSIRYDMRMRKALDVIKTASKKKEKGA